MGFLDRFMKTAGSVKDKAADLADQHGDTAKDAVDKAADLASQKTGHQHDDKIDKGAEAVKDAIDDLAGDDSTST